MLRKTKLSFFLFLFLSFSLVSIPFVHGDVGDGSGVDSYSTDIIPQSTPTPNATSTPGVTPDDEQLGVDFESITPMGIPLTFGQIYYPATVTLSYATAPEYSLTPNSVSPEHGESLSPTGMTFEARGAGTFSLHFEVRYLAAINQTIFLTVTGTGGAGASYPIPCFNSGFDLDVVISTCEEPRFPTKEEMGDYMFGQIKDTVENTAKFNSLTMSITLAVAIAVAVVVVLLVVNAIRQHVRMTRIETQGL